MTTDQADGGGAPTIDRAEDIETPDNSRRASPPAKREAWGRWAPWLLVAVTLLAMGRVVSNRFSGFDDEHTIWRNPLMNPPRFTPDGVLGYWSHSHMSLWAPVTYTAWAALAKATYLDEPDA